jgi:trk system potassium uptake protein TrkH
VRLGSSAIGSDVASGILVYGGAYFMLFALASLAMVALGLSPLSAMSAVVACLSCIGPGLDQVGPTQNFEFIPGAGKLVLILCMIAGRLEIFALFALFSPETWRR